MNTAIKQKYGKKTKALPAHKKLSKGVVLVPEKISAFNDVTGEVVKITRRKKTKKSNNFTSGVGFINGSDLDDYRCVSSMTEKDRKDNDIALKKYFDEMIKHDEYFSDNTSDYGGITNDYSDADSNAGYSDFEGFNVPPQVRRKNETKSMAAIKLRPKIPPPSEDEDTDSDCVKKNKVPDQWLLEIPKRRAEMNKNRKHSKNSKKNGTINKRSEYIDDVNVKISESLFEKNNSDPSIDKTSTASNTNMDNTLIEVAGVNAVVAVLNEDIEKYRKAVEILMAKKENLRLNIAGCNGSIEDINKKVTEMTYEVVKMSTDVIGTQNLLLTALLEKQIKDGDREVMIASEKNSIKMFKKNKSHKKKYMSGMTANMIIAINKDAAAKTPAPVDEVLGKSKKPGKSKKEAIMAPKKKVSSSESEEESESEVDSDSDHNSKIRQKLSKQLSDSSDTNISYCSEQFDSEENNIVYRHKKSNNISDCSESSEASDDADSDILTKSVKETNVKTNVKTSSRSTAKQDASKKITKEDNIVSSDDSDALPKKHVKLKSGLKYSKKKESDDSDAKTSKKITKEDNIVSSDDSDALPKKHSKLKSGLKHSKKKESDDSETDVPKKKTSSKYQKSENKKKIKNHGKTKKHKRV